MSWGTPLDIHVPTSLKKGFWDTKIFKMYPKHAKSEGLGHAGESPQIKRLPLTRQPTNILFFLQYLYRLKLRNSPAA